MNQLKTKKKKIEMVQWYCYTSSVDTMIKQLEWQQ